MQSTDESTPDSQTHTTSSLGMFTACLLAGIVAGGIFVLLSYFFTDWETGNSSWFITGCVVASIVLGVFNYALVNKLNARGNRHVIDVLKKIGDGDLSTRCDTNGSHSMSDIAEQVNTMADNLTRKTEQVLQSTQSIMEAVNEMADVSRQTSYAIQKQRIETDQAATAMNEMAFTVQEVARNAHAAADAAKDADGAAKEGSALANSAMTGMQALNIEVEKAGTVIVKLEENSQNIGVILEVIQGIAEQTNLLALNAAIEAARAGEQGRGFAVVADEVRTLASRTQQSTEEIRNMIDQLQVGAEGAVRVMSEAQVKAKEGETSVEKTAEALNAIGRSVATIDDMNTQIASAAEQQGLVAEEINKNIVSISQVASQASSDAAQTEYTGKEIVRLVNELFQAVNQFRT